MLRATVSPMMRQSISVVKTAGRGSVTGKQSIFYTTTSLRRQAMKSSATFALIQSPRDRLVIHSKWNRSLSSNTSNDDSSKSNNTKSSDGSDRDELVLTPGQKVVAGTRLTMWAGIFVFASACGYYILRELIPTKMSPNTIFDKSLALVRQHPQVQQRFGATLKGYGRDHGGHREGRRNFVEHTQYTDKEDDSKRTRVRYNLEGQYGHAFVFAEQSSNMAGGEFVYVLVQDKANGRVITVVDNRSAMAVQRMAAGSKEGQEAFGNLLTGGANKK